MTTLLLLTSAPTSRLAWHAYELARTMINQQQALLVFFYQDAVQVANQLTWRPADESALAKKWSSLNIDLPICVTAALARGITDEDNAKRHHLARTNLAQGFRMAGLGELADAMLKASRIIQL